MSTPDARRAATAPAPGVGRRAAGATQRKGPSVLVPVLLVLVGIAITIYPIVATFSNDIHQHSFAARYNSAVAAVGPAQIDDQLGRARAYNAAVPATALRDPWTTSDDDQDTARADYLSQLTVTDAMARLRIPEIGVDLPVYHGTEEPTLARGVGHLFGSSLPVGGVDTHSVLTAHSGWANATLFDRLPELEVGDVFYVDVLGQTLAYQIKQADVVLPSQLDSLQRHDGKDVITLITCTPRAINSHRLLLHAERIPHDGPAAPTNPLQTFQLVLQPWMMPRLVGAGAGLLLVVVILVLAARRRNRQPRAHRAQEAS